MAKQLSLVIFHRVYFVTFINGLCPNGAYTRRLLSRKVHNSSFTHPDAASLSLFYEKCEKVAIKWIFYFPHKNTCSCYVRAVNNDDYFRLSHLAD